MNNLLTVILVLLELAPESGKWVIERIIWALTSQIVSLTGDIRGSRNTAEWVEPQRGALLSLLGRLLGLSGNHSDLAVGQIEGHMQYLENRGAPEINLDDARLELLKGAGSSEEVIKEYLASKNAKNKLNVGIKQQGIKRDRNAFKAEVQCLIGACMTYPMHEKEINSLSEGTQLFILNGINRQCAARVSWLMDNIMREAGELTLFNVFQNGNYVAKAIHALEEDRDTKERAGYERQYRVDEDGREIETVG